MGPNTILANTALVAAIVAGLGWVFNKVYDIASRRLERRRERRAAIIRFYVDARLRARSLAPSSDSAFVTEFLERTAALIKDHEARGRPFRLYGIQIADTRSHDLIDQHLATFDLKSAELIREVILLDRQMVAHYDRLGSKDFEDLDAERKVEAVENWLLSAQALSLRLQVLDKAMRAWPELHGRNAEDVVPTSSITEI